MAKPMGESVRECDRTGRRTDSRWRENGDSLVAFAGLRWTAGVVVLALLLSACGTNVTGELSQAAKTTASVEFATEESLTGGGDTAGARVSNVTFVALGQQSDAERVVIEFGTEQASANAAPQWRIEKAAAAGVLRIHLLAVMETGVTDFELPESFALLRRAFVVRAPDGSLFVDVFIPASFKYRVEELGDPARLVIDVAADGTDTYALPAVSKLTVLTSPQSGATVQGQLTVSGYSRNFEANNVIILQDSEGNELARAIATSSDYIETWGYFSTELTVPNRTGAGSLLVGDFDAQDGSFQGVTIPVQFGGS